MAKPPEVPVCEECPVGDPRPTKFLDPALCQIHGALRYGHATQAQEITGPEAIKAFRAARQHGVGRYMSPLYLPEEDPASPQYDPGRDYKIVAVEYEQSYATGGWFKVRPGPTMGSLVMRIAKEIRADHLAAKRAEDGKQCTPGVSVCPPSSSTCMWLKSHAWPASALYAAIASL